LLRLAAGNRLNAHRCVPAVTGRYQLASRLWHGVMLMPLGLNGSGRCQCWQANVYVEEVCGQGVHAPSSSTRICNFRLAAPRRFATCGALGATEAAAWLAPGKASPGFLGAQLRQARGTSTGTLNNRASGVSLRRSRISDSARLRACSDSSRERRTYDRTSSTCSRCKATKRRSGTCRLVSQESTSGSIWACGQFECLASDSTNLSTNLSPTAPSHLSYCARTNYIHASVM
jgi:hypothetical protein